MVLLLAKSVSLRPANEWSASKGWAGSNQTRDVVSGRGSGKYRIHSILIEYVLLKNHYIGARQGCQVGFGAILSAGCPAGNLALCISPTRARLRGTDHPSLVSLASPLPGDGFQNERPSPDITEYRIPYTASPNQRIPNQRFSPIFSYTNFSKSLDSFLVLHIIRELSETGSPVAEIRPLKIENDRKARPKADEQAITSAKNMQIRVLTSHRL